LAEISPMIPPKIIELFRIRFADNPKYESISFPEETNGLQPVHVYKDHRNTTPSESPNNTVVNLPQLEISEHVRH